MLSIKPGIGKNYIPYGQANEGRKSGEGREDGRRERQRPWRCKVNTSRSSDRVKKYSNSQAEESLRIPELSSEDEYYSEISLNEGKSSKA